MSGSSEHSASETTAGGAQAFFQAAIQFLGNNQADRAIEALLQAIRLRPEFVEAWVNLGAALHQTGQLEQACGAIHRALAIQPDHVEALGNLAAVLRRLGRPDEAIAASRRGLSLCPSSTACLNNLGMSLQDCGRFDEAIEAFQQAVALLPGDVRYLNNLGVALKDSGRVAESLQVLRRTRSLHPGSPQTEWNLAFSALLNGDFAQGWPLYESRWQVPALQAPARHADIPRWDGQPPAGRRILLWSEQGLGDTIQFVRYAPLVADQGGRIIVECQPELLRLFHDMPGDITFVEKGCPLPDFDVHCPFLSLPLALGTELDTIPSNVPYIVANQNRAVAWESRLSPRMGRRRIGIAWAGNAKPNRLRSIPAEMLGSLTALKGFSFHSLQKQVGQDPVQPPCDQPTQDFSREIVDFADVAALIGNMDLVITIDTAAAHLAGAMGVPTWTLLPSVPDWRWMRDRSDTPWYPTMRLFRQPRFGDWKSVVEQITSDLAFFREHA